MLEDHLKNVQDELGTTQVKTHSFEIIDLSTSCFFSRDSIMHGKTKLKPKNI